MIVQRAYRQQNSATPPQKRLVWGMLLVYLLGVQFQLFHSFIHGGASAAASPGTELLLSDEYQDIETGSVTKLVDQQVTNGKDADCLLCHTHLSAFHLPGETVVSPVQEHSAFAVSLTALLSLSSKDRTPSRAPPFTA